QGLEKSFEEVNARAHAVVEPAALAEHPLAPVRHRLAFDLASAAVEEVGGEAAFAAANVAVAVRGEGFAAGREFQFAAPAVLVLLHHGGMEGAVVVELGDGGDA